MIKRITKTKGYVNIINKHSFKLFSKMKFMASLFAQQYFQWLSLSLPTCGPKTSPSTHCLPLYNRLPPTSWQKLVLSLTTASACCCLTALSHCGVCQQSSATEPSATLSLTSCSTGLLLARYAPLKNFFSKFIFIGFCVEQLFLKPLFLFGFFFNFIFNSTKRWMCFACHNLYKSVLCPTKDTAELNQFS